MRIERLTPDKVRFFLTFDDLTERNIDKDDLWKDLPKVHELFNDMMEQAYYEVGFEVNGPVAVEVFALPSQGMVIVVTKASQEDVDEEAGLDGETIELEVTLEERDDIACAFRDFEDVLAVAPRIRAYVGDGGRLYHYKGHYVLYFEPLKIGDEAFRMLVAVLAEYGEIAPITVHVLEEYGRKIIPERALAVLAERFGI
ncbi:MAG: genetic competence negative regulator [Hydrogenibacillus sp.]|nr:genetic competence negative regulator [Hydrogenibacillus sp.]